MPQDYPDPVTALHLPVSRLHAALADRDVGLWCCYCAAQLGLGAIGYQRVVLGPCPGGHRDVYPCDQGCEGSVYFALLPGYARAEADHVVPKAKGGSDQLDNRVLACAGCNGAKRADSLLVFLARRAAA